jgi:ubiquinone/menaquinone biosynthesis C-methylase UbiE
MPYPDDTFDTIVNTMAFTGYSDGERAMREMLRVLKPDGVLLLLDYDFPPDRNVFGYLFVRFIEACGDIIKNIPQIITSCGAKYERRIIGGAKAIQLFIITK